MQNFKTLRQPLLGDLAEGWREREKRERKIMPSLMVTSPSAQRRSDQLGLGIAVKFLLYPNSNGPLI